MSEMQTVNEREFKCLCIIPARGGSKGVLNKNIIDINGQPLISYAIRSAYSSNLFERVIVSTDSFEISKVAKKYKAELPFVRPTDLATDDAKVDDVIVHALKHVEKYDKKYDYVCLLQPTSPLLDVDDIQKAVCLLLEKNADMVISVGKSPIKTCWARELPKDLSMKAFADGVYGTNKQCFEDTYFLNGAFYIGKWDIFYNKKNYYEQDTYAYKMSYEKSIDIDTYDDIKLVKYFLKKAGK